MFELQPDQISSLLLEKSNPRLYLDETLNYGELKTVNQFGEKKPENMVQNLSTTIFFGKMNWEY